MNDPIVMPDCKARFATPAGELVLDPVEALQQFNDVTRRCAEEKLTNFEYIDRFAEWLKERAGVALAKAEVLWLVRQLDRAVAEGKDGAGPGPS